jgi:peroxiredoxin
MKLRSLPAASVLALLLSALPAAVSALDVGEKAPDFTLPSTKGGKLQLSNLAGKQNVVIQFYVLDYSPG